MTEKRKELFRQFKERMKAFFLRIEEERIARIELIHGLKDKEMKNQLLERFK